MAQELRNNNSLNEELRYIHAKGKYIYARFVSNFERTLKTVSIILSSITVISSIVCIVCLIVYAGYNLSFRDANIIRRILHATQIIFALHIVYQLLFFFRETIRNSKIIKWIVDIAIIVSIIAWIIPPMEHPWIPILKSIFLGNKYLFISLASYSIVEICYALSYIPSRRTNPSLLMALSFLLFIILGSFVLMLPRCTHHGISYFDSLFIASSAVSITGLSPVDIPSTFTPFGIIALSVLIQLGSLGIITFTSFFAMFFTGNTSIYNQLLLRDVIYSKSMNALLPTLLYVLGFTLTIEAIGAVMIYFTIPVTLGMSIEDKVLFSLFHAMSSFCNAGFSCLPEGMANPMLMHSNQLIYIVTCILIFAGGIGFPILVNVKEILKSYIHRAINHIRHTHDRTIPLHLFDLNTKMVLYTTLSILVIGSVCFFVFESSNTMKDMSIYERCVQSVFNSLIPRSAGFASVNPSNFLNVTLLLIVIQMIIGGSSQSMAGGIKVNTLGTVLLNLRSVVMGHKGIAVFHRSISIASIRRANAVVIVACISLVLYLSVIFLLEKSLPTKSLIFETVSALFTVGSSLGITGDLSDASKVVLSTAMFLGRVGILSMLAGLVNSKKDVSEYYPTENVIIN